MMAGIGLKGLFRSDLPVARDSSGGFLPWLIALMVFFAAMATTGSVGLTDMIARWNRDVAGTLTVQIPPVIGTTAKAKEETAARVERAVRLLQSLPNVVSASEIPADKLAALLEPWLGSRELIDELPTPRLIDVTLNPQARPSLEDLQTRLKDAVEGATIDDHQVWMSKLISLAEGLQKLAWGVIALVSFTTTTTVIYATRTALAVHRPHIEVLHFVGATDSYIARQFASRGLALGLLGGLGGLLGAVPTLWAIVRLSEGLQGGLIPAITIAPLTWALLGSFPVIAGLIAMITAHITVRRQLSGML
ncbi:cell division protein FtsX [Insolitispirillum peregrinum]|uniref:Cell division transport system permease protein n=1 Tax=Insolitispirillum peregrinum TaxID=80876 RepID=A0A1N7JX69_9PROT|nr:FtsX-like permease family protein [Insolitispirillum peregrinum]SIS53945.1 cell division transport system permease protein [Insolitispirillum peregrinum]